MFDSCIDDSYDAEPIAVREEKFPVARKQHTCMECGEPIPAGARYEYVKGLCDGSWFTHKTCWSCKVMRDSLFHSWTYGQVWQAFKYAYDFTPFEVPSSE